MAIVGIDIGSSEIRVQNGDTVDDILKSQIPLRIELDFIFLIYIYQYVIY